MTFYDPPTQQNFFWGWVLGVRYLALLLIPYGLIQAIHRARHSL